MTAPPLVGCVVWSLSKEIPKFIVRLICDSYLRQKTCVIWNLVKSVLSKNCNAVKQGGVLYALLFSMYIDLFLVELSKSGYMCHLDVVYIGALSYADDITISCPSIVENM